MRDHFPSIIVLENGLLVANSTRQVVTRQTQEGELVAECAFGGPFSQVSGPF